ncbi:MAG TPA: ABC transporter substrate-binding protein, partial [Casimicrobium sp.]|nr:ABC transporter substrate-binding protein [Casimicrobium sp.]
MNRAQHLLALAACTAALAATGAIANPLRWAAAGDPQTMDPHSQNEGLTNSVNSQVYEFLMIRDKKLKLG